MRNIEPGSWRNVMNIIGIMRRIGSIPGVQRQTLLTLAKCVALLEGLDRTDRRRRRRRKPQPPKPPKD
jgi:hypothetical protein